MGFDISNMKIFRSKLSVFGGLVLGLVVLYWPGLSGGFFFDDFANIIDSSEVQMQEVSLHALKMAWESGNSGPLGRPISMLSFALNYYFSGFSPFWFKLTNLAIHGINSFFVYVLLWQISRAVDCSQFFLRRHWICSLLAMLWAFHPLQITSILYVVQRMTSLSSMFILLALILHILGRQEWVGRKSIWALIFAWCCLFPLSLLCKETGVIFVGYVFAYELFIRPTLYHCYDRPGIVFLVTITVVAVILLVYLLFFSSWLLGGFAGRSFTLNERLLTESRIVWEYVGMILTPDLSKFALYHDDIALSTGLINPISTIFSLAGLGLLATIMVFLAKKLPLISFSIAWYLIGHSLESTIIPLELMHEHRNYLPSLGVIFIFLQLTHSKYCLSRNVEFFGLTASLGFLLYCAVLTYIRADMYGDDIRRTQIEAQYHESSVRSQYDAGGLLVNIYNMQRSASLVPLAMNHFKRANSIDPSFKMALVGMLQLQCLESKRVDDDTFGELVRRFSVGIVAVHERTTINGIANALNAGTLCLSRQQVDQIFSSILSNSFSRDSDKAKILNRYAMYLWLGQGDYPAALNSLMASFRYGDVDPVNRLNAIQLMRILGDTGGVLDMLEFFDGLTLSELDNDSLNDLKKNLIVDGILKSEAR